MLAFLQPCIVGAKKPLSVTCIPNAAVEPCFPSRPQLAACDTCASVCLASFLPSSACSTRMRKQLHQQTASSLVKPASAPAASMAWAALSAGPKATQQQRPASITWALTRPAPAHATSRCRAPCLSAHGSAYLPQRTAGKKTHQPCVCTCVRVPQACKAPALSRLRQDTGKLLRAQPVQMQQQYLTLHTLHTCAAVSPTL